MFPAEVVGQEGERVGDWVFTVSVNPVTDSELRIAAHSNADGGILMFACRDGTQEVHVSTGSFLRSEGERVLVRYRFSQDAELQEGRWTTFSTTSAGIRGSTAQVFVSQWLRHGAQWLGVQVVDSRNRGHSTWWEPDRENLETVFSRLGCYLAVG